MLGLVPSGRGNDFARQLGIPADPAGIVRTLLTARRRRVDVIDAGGTIVVGSVYAGVDSLASELVNRVRLLPRSLHYPHAAVRALSTFRPVTYTVTVDGDRQTYDAFTVIVANSGFYGKGMHVAPAALVDDGVLDVLVDRSVAAAVRPCAARVYAGTHVELPQVQVLTGREVTIEAVGVLAYGDGDHVGRLPITAGVRPGALTVLAAY